MEKLDALIRTKLRLPFVRPELAARPQLQARLLAGLRVPLTLVIAPAGFGKTTLVAGALASTAMPAAWLSLDPDDNQGDRFLRYLVAALQTVDPGMGEDAIRLMSSIQPALPEAVLTGLVNDLDDVSSTIILALDDYQFIHNPAVHTAVAFLLEHCPPSFHLVISARSDPPLPLARLRARGQVVELRAADLRFSEAETAQFLNQVMGLGLEPNSITALSERTEGWIAGLQMAALSMRDRKDLPGFIQGFSGTHRYILDYLIEEVLNRQPVEIQDFLLSTSILERLTAPLCDALLDDAAPEEAAAPRLEPGSPNHSTAALQYLERENLFLVALDDERVWFRYHHLFADLLRARLERLHGERVTGLHQSAAAWLEQNGLLAAAIHHLFAARQPERAADLIERYGPAHLAENDPAIIQMAEGLPPEMLLQRPKIALYQAWLHLVQGSMRKTVPLLVALKRQLAAAGPQPGQEWVSTIVSLALAFLAPAESAAQAELLPDDALLEQIPADELTLRNTADILYGMALARRGQMARAVQTAERCIEREKRSARQAVPSVAPFLARIYLMQGRLHTAAALCREFLDPLQAGTARFIATAGDLEIVLGEVLLEWNCLEEAGQRLRRGLQANASWGNIMTEAFGLVALARLLAAQGDFADAMQTAGQLEARLQGDTPPREFSEAQRTLRAGVWLAMGDLEEAAKWAEQVQRSEDYRLHPDLYRLALARLGLAWEDYAGVEGLLSGQALPQPPGSDISRRVEAGLLLAIAAAGRKRPLQALAGIETCLSLAEPEGYLRVFLDAGEPARALLEAYLHQQEASHKPFARQILAAFPPAANTASPVSPTLSLAEALTARELDVLRLMAEGCTNPVIARRLVVAPGTIKAHAASIYRKLDATNRTEAVARARRAGLLD